MENPNYMDLLRGTFKKLYDYVLAHTTKDKLDTIPQLHLLPESVLLFACSKLKQDNINQEVDKYLDEYNMKKPEHKNSILQLLKLIFEIIDKIRQIYNN